MKKLTLIALLVSGTAQALPVANVEFESRIEPIASHSSCVIEQQTTTNVGFSFSQLSDGAPESGRRSVVRIATTNFKGGTVKATINNLVTEIGGNHVDADRMMWKGYDTTWKELRNNSILEKKASSDKESVTFVFGSFITDQSLRNGEAVEQAGGAYAKIGMIIDCSRVATKL
ncbi:hypothetical protein [Vibrio vulnificus]|uniref:hypothetical protein n=1 Tax=Vibrio vulnificus TaxID=672 RepID=UPI003241C1C4